MGAHFEGKRGRRGFLPLVTVVCLILLVLLAVAQVTHTHTNQADADHCPLCVLMHTVAPAAMATAAIVIVRLGVVTPQLRPVAIARQPQSRLFIRPPPVSR